MYRVRSQLRSAISRSGCSLTLATSVYPSASPSDCTWRSVSAIRAGGTASTARSTGSGGVASWPAPIAAAVRTAVLSRSRRYTVTPREASASATDVPISPVPTTAAVRTTGTPRGG